MSGALALENVEVFFGRAQVLFGVTLALAPGEAAVLLGRNGAGKSTTLKSAIGLVRPAGGRVRFGGRRIDALAPWEIARLGLGYVPEERRIFGALSVEENIEAGRLPARPAQEPWTRERVFVLFPALAALARRRASTLSGGEQQMLAIARTLMGNPGCLLLDEPFEGLAPVVVDSLLRALDILKSQGLSMLVSEQNLRFAASVADRAHLIDRGVIRYSGSMAELAANEEVRAAYLAM